MKHCEIGIWFEQAKTWREPRYAHTCACGTTWRAMTPETVAMMVAHHLPNCKEKKA